MFLLWAVLAVQLCRAGTDSTAFIPLSGNIFSNKTLEKGRYLISSNLRIGKEAVLTIEAGSHLVFNPGTEIIIIGGLKVEGNVIVGAIQSDDSSAVSILKIITYSKPSLKWVTITKP